MEIRITRINERNQLRFLSLFDGQRAKTAVRLGAVDERGNILGAEEVTIFGGCFEITFLYVLPEYRRLGVGRALYEAACSLLEGTSIGVMSASYTDDEDLDGFFTKQGFEFYRKRDTYILPFSNLKDNKKLERIISLADQTGSCRSFTELSGADMKVVERFVVARGYNLKSARYNADISWAAFTGTRPASCLLCRRDPGVIRIELLLGDELHQEAVLAPVGRLCSAIESIPDNMSVRITFFADNPEIDRFARSVIMADGISNVKDSIRAIKKIG